MRSTIILAVAAFVAAGSATFLARQMAAKTPSPPPVTTAAPASAPDRPARVILLAGRGGHFDVGATVNDKVLNFVVDTGASLVALTHRDAERLGLRLTPRDFIHPVKTANGVTNAADVKLASIRIKGIEVRNVNAMVLPPGALEINLLGNSFLSRLKGYEVRSGQLTLEQ